MALGVGAFILLALLACVACARAGSGLGTVFFFAVALVLFVSTPMGSGVPGAVLDFVSGVSEATGPTLHGGDSQ